MRSVEKATGMLMTTGPPGMLYKAMQDRPGMDNHITLSRADVRGLGRASHDPLQGCILVLNIE